MAAGYRRGKTSSASDGQGLPVPLYQCKTDYFLGQRGHFTFYTTHSLFSGFTLILKAEGGWWWCVCVCLGGGKEKDIDRKRKKRDR